MTWKRFQRAIWGVLAVCTGGMVLSFLVSGKRLLLIGQVSGGDIFGVLLLVADE